MAQGQKSFYYVIAGIGLVGAIWLGMKLKGSSEPFSVPANVVITASDSGFHGYLTGNENAPIEVVEYGDLECNGCQYWAMVQFPDIQKRLLATGKIRFRFRDFPWDDLHPHPRVASLAAACANDQGRFWDMAHEIYSRQGELNLMKSPLPGFRDAAKAIGLDVDKWSACMKTDPYAGRIQASLNEGLALGIKSTPSFLIGGRIYESLTSDQMVQIVDSLIAAKPVGKP